MLWKYATQDNCRDKTMKLSAYRPNRYIQGTVSRNYPSFFPVFHKKRLRTKPQEIIDKASNHNGFKVVLRLPTGGVNFVFYPLSYICFTSSLFVVISLFASSPATNRVFHPPAWEVIRKSKTTLTPTTDADLSTTETLLQPLHFRRCIYRHSCRSLRQRPPFPRLR